MALNTLNQNTFEAHTFNQNSLGGTGVAIPDSQRDKLFISLNLFSQKEENLDIYSGIEEQLSLTTLAFDEVLQIRTSSEYEVER